MRISDWSSDVCSSDLGREARFRGDDVDDARGRVLAEQRALRTAQQLDALDAEQIAERHVGPDEENAVDRNAGRGFQAGIGPGGRSEEHTYELQSLMRISYAVFCLKKKTRQFKNDHIKSHQ